MKTRKCDYRRPKRHQEGVRGCTFSVNADLALSATNEVQSTICSLNKKKHYHESGEQAYMHVKAVHTTVMPAKLQIVLHEELLSEGRAGL